MNLAEIRRVAQLVIDWHAGAFVPFTPDMEADTARNAIALADEVERLQTQVTQLVSDSCEDDEGVRKLAKLVGVPESELSGEYRPSLLDVVDMIEAKVKLLQGELFDAQERRTETVAMCDHLQAENEQYRRWFGCPRCGMDHPTCTMCPPYEMRTSGRDWFHQAIRDMRDDLEKVTAERDRYLRFVKSVLNPEENGNAVRPHVRDDARQALGMKRVEMAQTDAQPTGQS